MKVKPITQEEDIADAYQLHMKMVAKWVGEYWQNLSEEIIRKSFATCGIIKLEGISLHEKLEKVLQSQTFSEETDADDIHTCITDEDSSC